MLQVWSWDGTVRFQVLIWHGTGVLQGWNLDGTGVLQVLNWDGTVALHGIARGQRAFKSFSLLTDILVQIVTILCTGFRARERTNGGVLHCYRMNSSNLGSQKG